MSPLPDRPGDVAVAVDVVVLSLAGERAEPVFLAQPRRRDPYHGDWSLPGGIVREREDLEAAVRRALARATALERVRHLEQLGTFGDPARDPRGRVVSVSYLALLPEPGPAGAGAGWLPATAPPPLAFDHAEILAAALERLRGKLSYSTVAYGLVGDEFTLSELQAVYEAVLGEELDKRNFRKKVLALGVLEEAEGMRRGAHRPARLYRFRHRELVLFDDVVTRAGTAL
ncbi:MAG TPA: NUDIX domain-containing protein [Egibacteraceae bacterium]|nr:NUDIX domain-containing protein [Egibacteraceae bacterium]